MHVRAFAATDRGRVRKGNEDAHHRGSTLFAVADGLGGRRAGEVASKTAIDALARFERARPDGLEAAGRTLADGFAAANRAVLEKGSSRADYAGMATTLTAALLHEDHLLVAHVGDSRAYLLRDGERLRQLTRDHTVVAQLVRQLRLSEEEAASHPFRSVLVTAVGLDADLEFDLLPPLALRPRDQVLICSDGLTDPVADRSIAEVLATRDDGDEACAALIEAANLAGGPDNITVVLLRVGS